MIDVRKIGERLSSAAIFVYGIFLSGGCEPSPKMISYGSNEYSQLEFEGTSFQHEPLISNYSKVWAGKSFSLAMFGGQYPIPPGLICKGDTSLGQCEFPDTMNIIMADSNYFTDLKLGFNHGLLSYGLSEEDTGWPMYYPVLPTFGKHLIAWGDSTYGQNQVPELSDSTKILMTAVGGNHNVVVTDDSVNLRVISWGDNTYGQCNVPERFNPIADSLEILSLEAGGNHTIIVYDSSGVTKMTAWGDNQYNQLNIPSEADLNGDLKFLAMKSGYNHNFAIFYDPTIDYADQVTQGIVVDTLFIELDWSFHPVIINSWGDNTYEQLEVPSLDGLLESWDAGGYHNIVSVARDWVVGTVQNIDPYNDEIDEYTLALSSGREIIGWGKNDFDQAIFPIEYRIEFQTYGTDSYGGFSVWENLPAQLALGENHTLISSSHLYRSPMLEYTFPEQFQGSLGDTIYQNITLKNIGPDTVFIDSIYLQTVGGYGTIEDPHPFYLSDVGEDYILFGDSISVEVFCVYDSSHELNINGELLVAHGGWWQEEVLLIPISSLLGSQVSLSSVGNFQGKYGEYVTKPLTIYNDGSQIVYLDSLSIPSPFSYEPFEENYIDPGDSLVIDLTVVFPGLPAWNQNNGTLFISNFNTTGYSVPLTYMRYLGVGDHLDFGFLTLNSAHQNCNSFAGPMYASYFDFADPDEMFNNLNFYNVSDFYTNIHHFDFGYTSSDNRELYASQLDSLYQPLREYSYFLSLIGLGSDLNSDLPWPGNLDDDCDTLSMEFEHHDIPVFYQDQSSDYVFEDWVESVIVDQNGIITYIDTFNIESLQLAIEHEINECGYDCLPDNAINMQPDTIEISVQLGDAINDTISIENMTDHTIGYTLETRSGVSVANSIIFNQDNDKLIAPWDNYTQLNLTPPLSLSFWFKPLGSNWSNNGEHTEFIAPRAPDVDQSDFWRIILTNDLGNDPRIGWQDEDDTFLATTPIRSSRWFHVVITLDSSSQNLKIYVNGNQEVDEQFQSDFTQINKLQINETFLTGEFTGFLSQMASWDSALDENDVELIYNLGIDTDLRNVDDSFTAIPNLYFYYNMENEHGFGSIIKDVSGNGFDARKSGYLDQWSTEIVQTGTDWLFIFDGLSASLATGENRLINYNANSDGLNHGTYEGQFNLYPDHNEYVVENTIVILNVVEDLSISNQNLPNNYALDQNYPNPFNPITKIHYNLPDAVKVKIDIYDIRGRKVKSLLNQFQEPGFKSIQWNASNDLGEKVSSGMYFYRIETQDFKQTKKMILLK